MALHAGPQPGALRRARGFSLMELLVVTAIVSILAAMLLPVFENSIEQTRVTCCMNNMRQQMAGVTLWSTDRRETIPFGDLRNFFTYASTDMLADFYANQMPRAGVPTSTWNSVIYEPTACLYQTDYFAGHATSGKLFFTGLGVTIQERIIEGGGVFKCPTRLARGYTWPSDGWSYIGYPGYPENEAKYSVYAGLPWGYTIGAGLDRCLSGEYIYRAYWYSNAKQIRKLSAWGNLAAVSEWEAWNPYSPNADGQRQICRPLGHPAGWNVAYWDGRVRMYTRDPERLGVLFNIGNPLWTESAVVGMQGNSGNGAWFREYDRQ